MANWRSFVLLLLVGLVPLGASAQRVAAGQLLVASPMLAGTDFAETVLLVVYHDDDSSLAIALNRPTWVDAAATFDDVEQLEGFAGTLWFGGPVSANQLLIVFENRGPAPEIARRVTDSIYVSPELELLEQFDFAAEAGPRFRLYAGYASWAPGRLEAEVESGAWRVLRATPEAIFTDDPEHLWERLPLLSGDLSAYSFSIE